MNVLRLPLIFALLFFVMACVTINVYFPAEAAERAADRIIQDVYGEQPDAGKQEPQSLIEDTGPVGRPVPMLLDWVIAPAHAAADISVSSPAIQQIQASMAARHQQLSPHYASGAIGMTRDGLIDIRDQKLLPLKDRNEVKNLVAKENRDRDALYREIARANGHPEWEAEIRQTFARRWVDNAPSGWWFVDDGGGWRRK